MLILTRSEVKRAVTMSEAIEAAARGLASYSSGKARVPLRTPIEADEGVSLFMPGFLPDSEALGIKIVSVFPKNRSVGLPTITALMVLNDMHTGEPIAAMEAGYLTALRTGAAAGVATRYLARKDAANVAIFGAGVQARTQLEAVMCVRECRRVSIYDVNPEAARLFADEISRTTAVEINVAPDPDSIVKDADIIIAATTSYTPVFNGSLVKPGTHINGIGSYTPRMQELDENIVSRADRFVCDSAEGAWKEAGDLLIPLEKGVIGRNRVDAEVGDLVLGRSPGRQNDHEITVYKGVGLAALDLVTARLVYERAISKGIGVNVNLFS